MSTFLKKAKAQNDVLKEIESEIIINTVEFNDMKLDYLVVILYANFERDLTTIIEKKIAANNNFNINYINYIKAKDHKLHRGITKDKFKDLVENTFNKKILDITTNDDWNIFIAFMEFRHSIAHATASYESKKDALIANMKTSDNLIRVFDEILQNLDVLKKTKKK